MASGGGTAFLGRMAEVLHAIALQDGALIPDKGLPRFVHGYLPASADWDAHDSGNSPCWKNGWTPPAAGLHYGYLEIHSLGARA